MSDEFEEYEDEQMVGEEGDEFYDADIAAILAQYRANELRKHMVGPIVSFVFHIVGLVLMCVLIKNQPPPVEYEIEVVMEELPIEELEEPPEIEPEEVEIEEDTTDDAPTMQTPDVPTDSPDSAIEDASDEAPQTDDNMEMEESLDVVPNSTPLTMPALYGGRTAAGRAGNLKRFGGAGSEDAVLRALRWLAKVQKENGSWENHEAATGLALLAFLAHGDTPLSEEFGTTVLKGLMWQSNRMITNVPKRAYTNGIATYSMAEAYAMTNNPTVKQAMELGLYKIVEGQQAGGGYDYSYKKGERWDLSVAGWNFQAMKAGFVAGAQTEGLKEAITKSVSFLKNTAYKSGSFGYSSPGGNAGGNMPGVGIVGLQLLGHPKSNEVTTTLEKSTIGMRLPLYEKYRSGNFIEAGKHVYGWYYDTQAAFNAQGKTWKKWNKVFKPALIKGQHKEGYWMTKDGHGNAGESVGARVYCTTWCVLQLEVYYRYLPSFKLSNLKKSVGAGEGGGIDADDDDIDIDIE
jgi:hypothetical protein